MNNDMFKSASAEEKKSMVKLALGRLFLLGSRPFQKGDIEQYEACRAIILACSE